MTIDTLVLDIEGTVCPITFVKDSLFPYFVEKFPTFIDQLDFPLDPQSDDPIVKILDQLPHDIKESSINIINHFKDLVAKDVKDPILKSLQGFIWKAGYENGDLKAPVYEDSIKFIKEYPNKAKTQKIYIYSSGSIKAQILLFGYVKDPTTNDKSLDLNPYLSGYFDITTAGYKTESESYDKILQEIGKSDNSKSVLFLSDNVNEVKAAIKAGMQSYIVVRPGNAPITEQDKSSYTVIDSLDQLQL
ncbi:HAD-like domain-containing protein [Scheffersomyces amazonensis]|uniref:HAD-like domain-containing protein n=1 Tax=Scheffersomyces amazonensis TaxID=1078765 RepID=UPI00315C84E9